MSTVLVVDGDRNVLKLVQRALADSNITVLTSTTVVEGLALLEQHGADLLIIDIKLPGLTCPETPDRIRQIDPKVPVTYITVSGASDLAIRAMQLGAFDFLLKPLDAAQVREVVQRAMAARRLTKKPIIVQEASDERGDEGSSGDVLIGRSGPMLDVYKEIGRAAGQDVTVLICGESGTGKELVARAVFQHSSRKDRPFLAVNCAALTTTLLESELFGHEKGAFTGADKGRIGKFEQCHGGTIFLDEVGDMSQELQCKMLRLVQEQKFERVGGAKTIQTDVRIIAATNHDLEQMVDEGEFRLDLYHRLNDYRINLPPLRERDADVELLIQHYLDLLAKQLGKPIDGVSPEAFEMLKQYQWPGNVRELQTVLKKMLLNTTGPVLATEIIPSFLRRAKPTANNSLGDLQLFIDHKQRTGSHNLYAETLEVMERYLITRLLRENDGNQSQTAKALGITRGSLRHKIRALDLAIDHVVHPKHA